MATAPPKMRPEQIPFQSLVSSDEIVGAIRLSNQFMICFVAMSATRVVSDSHSTSSYYKLVTIEQELVRQGSIVDCRLAIGDWRFNCQLSGTADCRSGGIKGV